MSIALAGQALLGLAALLAAPETAFTLLAWLAAGLCIVLYARLPPPLEEISEAMLFATSRAM